MLFSSYLIIIYSNKQTKFGAISPSNDVTLHFNIKCSLKLHGQQNQIGKK